MAVIVPTSLASVEHDPVGKGFRLLNDQASPGNNMVYGTDGGGVKGWKVDPAGVANIQEDTTVIGAATFFVRYVGASAPVFNSDGGPGLYLLDLTAGQQLINWEFTGNNTILTASLSLVLRIFNGVSGKHPRFTMQILNRVTDQIADHHVGGNSPTMPVTGTGEITATWQNMNVYAGIGWRIMANPTK